MLSLSDTLTILVLEDNAIDLALINQMLLSSNLKVDKIHSTDSVKTAKKYLKSFEINLVLLDLTLSDSSGMHTFIQLKALLQKIPVIILTGLSDSQVALDALNHGAQDYLVKGEFKTSLLVKSVQYSIERKNAENKLFVLKEMYREMFYKNPFPAWIFDNKTFRILEVNDAAIEKYGYKRSEFLKLTLLDICYAEDVEQLMLEIGRSGQGVKLIPKVSRHRKKNGSTIIVEVSYYKVSYFGESAMQAQIIDVTEKVRLQGELKLKHLQLTAAVLTAQENERKGIGEELHDNINQILATVQLSLGFALDNSEKRTEMISTSMKNTSLAIEEIRKLSKALILPGNLMELGLVTSLEELIKDFIAISGLNIRMTTHGFKKNNVSEKQMVAIFRIVQEQLNNIVKHADATTVTIRLSKTDKKIRVLITDDGKGFNTEIHRKGIGINNIISRAELFNGRVALVSAPGRGCRLLVELNIKIASHEAATYISTLIA